jgi:uncharacterized membrane protein
LTASIAHSTSLNVTAPPWQYNPSAWRQRIAILVLGSLACAISLYMALYQWRLIGGVWDPLFGDQSQHVLDSDVSHRMQQWLRIPDAALGALGYFSEVVLALAGSTRRWQYRPWMVLLFGFDVIPLGLVSVVLVILQGTVVGSWCFLCLVTAAISLLLVYLAYDEVWSTLKFLARVWRHTRDVRIVWLTFWGHATPDARRIGHALLREHRPAQEDA